MQYPFLCSKCIQYQGSYIFIYKDMFSSNIGCDKNIAYLVLYVIGRKTTNYILLFMFKLLAYFMQWTSMQLANKVSCSSSITSNASAYDFYWTQICTHFCSGTREPFLSFCLFYIYMSSLSTVILNII